ncbi:MAG: hypothetical protein ABH879_10115 [archaeon]
MAKPKWQTMLIKAGFAFAAMLISALILEAFFTLFLPQRADFDYRCFDEDLGWRYKPSQNITFRNYRDLDQKPEYTVFETNSAGFRDDETPVERPAGEKRIMVLGDSSVAGLAVEKDERFTEVLEEELGRAGLKANVLNAGIHEYGSYQEMAYYLTEGIRYDPGIVILGFYAENDLFDNCDESRGISFADEGGVLVPQITKKKQEPAIQGFFRRSQVFSFLVRLSYQPGIRKIIGRFGLVKTSGEDLESLYKTDESEGMSLCMNETIENIYLFSRTLEMQGTGFILMIIEDKKQMDPAEFGKYIRELGLAPGEVDPLKINRRFGALKERGVLVLDLYDVLKEYEDKNFYFTYDHHWNSRAHGIVGQALAEFIASDPVLSGKLD